MARDKCSCFADSVSDTPELKLNLQGTVKTRYFLLYLGRMRMRRFFGSTRQPDTKVWLRSQCGTEGFDNGKGPVSMLSRLRPC